MALVACPFCRELFEKGEAESCPVCGIVLERVEKLPPSQALLSELGEDGVPPEPQNERLTWTYLARGRGVMVGLSFVGLVLFFLPWIRLTLPYVADLTGFDIARRLGWPWGAAVAWVVLAPTVASRRTIAQLRGARVAAAMLSVVPGVTTSILFAFPPHGGIVPLRFTYAWPFGAMLFVSVAALLCAVRLGGRIDDIKLARGTSLGQALH